MKLKESNEILDRWEKSVQEKKPCPFCGIDKAHPVTGEPHNDNCQVLTAIARQEQSPKGRGYI